MLRLAQITSGLASWLSPTVATPQVGQTAKVGAPVKATPAQLGNAVVPVGHTLTAPVAPGRAPVGGGMPTAGPAVAIPTPTARYRARASYQVSTAPATNASPSPTPAVHVGAGSANPRDQFGGGAGMTGSPDQLAPIPEQRSNEPGAVEVVGRSAAPAPSVTRAGSTGADPSRPSLRPFATLLRAFDQQAVYGQGTAVGKLPLVLAPSLPITQAEDTAGALPNPGGSGVTTQAGIGGQPNTFRLMPGKWDQALVNTGGPTASQVGDTGTAAISSRRASGWRAKG